MGHPGSVRSGENVTALNWFNSSKFGRDVRRQNFKPRRLNSTISPSVLSGLAHNNPLRLVTLLGVVRSLHLHTKTNVFVVHCNFRKHRMFPHVVDPAHPLHRCIAVKTNRTNLHSPLSLPSAAPTTPIRSPPKTQSKGAPHLFSCSPREQSCQSSGEQAFTPS
jgi:hypothetical protein